jgi:hypothetical protein
VRQRQGDLRYSVQYSPRYEAFLDLDDANAFEHFATVAATWSVDRRTELHLDNRFSYSRGLRDVFEPTGPDPEEGEILIDREAVLRNAASASASRWLSPRTQLVMNLSQQYYDYEDEARSDATSFRGGASLRRLLTQRQSAGFGLAVTRQDNLDTDFQEGRGTTFFETFALYDLVISRTLTFSLAAGPSWVLPDEFEDDRTVLQYATTSASTPFGSVPFLADRASCSAEGVAGSCTGVAEAFDRDTGDEVFVPVSAMPIISVPFQDGAPEADGNLTIFGNVSLSYRREPFAWTLGYTRRASNTSGLGTSTNLDVARATATWSPARRWLLNLRAAWQRQTSASEIPNVAALVADAGATVFLNANGAVVDDPADAEFEVRNVALIDRVRTVDLIDDAVDTTSYTFDLRASHNLTRQLRLQGVASYWYQTSGGETGSDTQRQSLRFELGVTWSFDPIPL